ncbi:MAG TPA: toll/interleukin-1 receptor domain-containing protein [Candidatus Paceibacterota bacterium]|jgi:hypothetical protein|nr:toll/interleukin-1 receptor domain-containing protein [Candidatus Paceibacterota bacterium]
MNTEDIQTLIKILLHKERPDLASLLDSCFSEINSSGQYGSKYNSFLSEFLIYAPISKFYTLKDLKKDDKKIIFESIIDLYPITEEEPEITSFDIRMLKVSERGNILSNASTFIERNVRVFISYSHLDAKLAGGVKRGLEKLGMDVFIAHEDITPSSEWVETIIENLRSTDIFMPIITANFSESKWTDQESGIAFAKEKIIVPISVDGKHPYGFLNRFQSAKIKDEKLYLVPCDNIIEALIKAHSSFKEKMINALIRAFKESSSYDSAGWLSRLLTLYEDFDKEKIETIFKSAIENNQIFESRSARPHLKTLFSKNYKHLSKELISSLVEKTGDEFKI